MQPDAQVYSPTSRFVDDDEGQDSVEYGLIVTAVGLLVLIGGTSLGAHVHDWYAALAVRITSLLGA